MQDIHDFVVRSLEAAGKEKWPEIAEATDISVHTIIKVARRQTISPRYKTLAPLAKHFEAHPVEGVAPPEAVAQ
jgi:hypothetical protein